MSSSIVLSGPLLYHFENMANELSVELSYEDIRRAMIKIGFHIEVNQILIYTHVFTCSSSQIWHRVCVFPTGGERVRSDHLHRKRPLHVEIRLRLCFLCCTETCRCVLKWPRRLPTGHKVTTERKYQQLDMTENPETTKWRFVCITNRDSVHMRKYIVLLSYLFYNTSHGERCPNMSGVFRFSVTD